MSEERASTSLPVASQGESFHEDSLPDFDLSGIGFIDEAITSSSVMTIGAEETLTDSSCQPGVEGEPMQVLNIEESQKSFSTNAEISELHPTHNESNNNSSHESVGTSFSTASGGTSGEDIPTTGSGGTSGGDISTNSSNSTSSGSSCVDRMRSQERTIERLAAELERMRDSQVKLRLRVCVLGDVNARLTSESEEEKSRLLYKSISMTNEKISHYTGLPDAATFNKLLDFFPVPLNYYYKWKVKSMSKEDQLLLTLMKLRNNISHEMLGDWFQVSRHTVSNVLRTWVNALHTVLFKVMMAKVPSRNKTRQSMPDCLEGYENCRMIIDCTEMMVEKLDSLEEKNLLFSSYKHGERVKTLIGIAPEGSVVFSSDLFPGSNSDKTIVRESKVLEVFEPGDLILADKGFLIQEMLPPGVTLNFPPFLTTPQFTESGDNHYAYCSCPHSRGKGDQPCQKFCYPRFDSCIYVFVCKRGISVMLRPHQLAKATDQILNCLDIPCGYSVL